MPVNRFEPPQLGTPFSLASPTFPRTQLTPLGRLEMPRIELVIEVRVSPERCFDLSRDLDLHRHSLAHTNERAVAGRTTGLIEAGEQVTWRAQHFGVVFEHTALITRFDRPHHFQDLMIAGRFEKLRARSLLRADHLGNQDARRARVPIPVWNLGADR